MLRLGDYHTAEQDDFERTLSPERIVIHRKYQTQGWEYDIALLRLKGSEGNCVAFNPHIGAVCLPEPGHKWEKRPAACVITGWGITGNYTAQTIACLALSSKGYNDMGSSICLSFNELSS